MRAGVLHGVRDLRAERVPVPIPGPDGVVVKAAQSGGPAVGSRVAVEPSIRRCALCKSGRYNLCADVIFLSAPPVNGTCRSTR